MHTPKSNYLCSTNKRFGRVNRMKDLKTCIIIVIHTLFSRIIKEKKKFKIIYLSAVFRYIHAII